MIETRPAHRPWAPPFWAALLLYVIVALLHFLASALPAGAQAPLPAAGSEPGVTASTEPGTLQPDTARTEELSFGECHAPSTQEWVFIGVGTLILFLLCFFLLVRVVQRAFIRSDKNATLGRHFGISVTFLVSSLGMTVLAYLITGCLHRRFVLWLCFPLALWAIHGLYTLIVVKSE